MENDLPAVQALMEFGRTRFMVTVNWNGPPWYVVTQESGPPDQFLCDSLN